MVFHVGICPWLGQVSIYNSETKEITDIETVKVLNNDLKRVSVLYERIRSHITGDLGCVCICLYSDYPQEIRKKFIEVGLFYGFEKIEIICRLAAEFINAISQSHFNGEGVIWMFDGNMCHIWKKSSKKFTYIDNQLLVSKYGIQTVLKALKFTENPSFILYKQNTGFDETILTSFLTGVSFFTYRFKKWRRCALIKARINANDVDVMKFDADNVLDETLTINIFEKDMVTLKTFLSIPLTKHIKYKGNENVNMFSVSSVRLTLAIHNIKIVFCV